MTEETTSFKDTVSELVSKMTQDDSGKWALPEEAAADLDEATLYAVTSERRYRDTQGAYTRSQQEVKKQAAMADALEEHILTHSETPLTADQRDELADLKLNDPEAWREKLNTYEQTGKATIGESLAKIRAESSAKGELEIRTEQMAAWSDQTGIVLTDDVVENDIPPRLKRELESGALSFDDFLVKAGEYLSATKVIQGATDTEDPGIKSLGTVAGGSEPSNEANEGDFAAGYEKTVF